MVCGECGWVGKAEDLEQYVHCPECGESENMLDGTARDEGLPWLYGQNKYNWNRP